MNNQRRKEIAEISEEIEAIKARLESVLEEEQEAYDNLPEGIQDSDRGERMSEAISSLENALYDFDTIVENLSEAQQ